MKQRIDTPESEQIPDFFKMLDDLYVGNNVYLYGSAGTGKSTLAENLSYAHFGRTEGDGKPVPFVTINCTKYTSPIEIKGGQTIEGYKEGGLIEAWRDGKILVLDEVPKLDPNTASLLNDALAKSAKPNAIIFNGLNDPIAKHKDFGCIASGNTTGKGMSARYRGNQVQDGSLLDRFSGSFYHVGFNEILEKHLTYPAVLTICWKVRKEILSYEGNEAGNDDTEDIMTLRTMQNFQRIYELEMLRETGLKNSAGRTEKRQPRGKTLIDCIDSYFKVMATDKAEVIMEEIDYESFKNSYRGREMKEQFIKEYERRKFDRRAA